MNATFSHWRWLAAVLAAVWLGGTVAADVPRVVHTAPAANTMDVKSGSFDLVFVFSEPMKRVLAVPERLPGGPALQLLGPPRWEDTRTLVVPVLLAPGTTYRLGINTEMEQPFVSAMDDVPALPFTLIFRTEEVRD